ncbi:hypothetical protein ACFWY6_39825 [Streptomyces sp. NPDC059037]|uniref:hypothetical protein n=1 Tax=Streptomyces sp. NPDC059037 TaxID=3346710 RepID=UPI0036A96F45
MSAPLVVNTTDGVCWTRRAVTRGGLPLYALAGVCDCPELVMATLPELAEHGIEGSADALPMPVGPEPHAPSAAEDLAAIVRACPVDWLDAKYGADAEPGDIADTVYGAVRAEVLREEMANLRRVEFAGEKSSREAIATPRLTGRLAQLLDAIRTHRGEWTTKRVQDLYRGTPLAPPNAPAGRLRAVARGDLRDLHAWGHLVEHDEKGRHFYTLSTRKDGRS